VDAAVMSVFILDTRASSFMTA